MDSPRHVPDVHALPTFSTRRRHNHTRNGTLSSPSNTSKLAANREVKRGARCAARLFSPPFRRFARNDAAAFTAPAAACVATYAVAVSRDPGCVPPAFVPDVEDNESPIHEIKRKGGDLRSQKCSRYKPPHAHHCRVCKRCVLRIVPTSTNSVIPFILFLVPICIYLTFSVQDHHCI